jgi:hypothetical protein
MTGRPIDNTDYVSRLPWPENVGLQGGSRGVVFCADGSPTYETAFVEAFCYGTFLRGEGSTLQEADDACWSRFITLMACPSAPDHGPFEARQYTNGAGYCTRCGVWFPKVLPPSDPPPDPARKALLDRAWAGDEDALAEVLAGIRERRATRWALAHPDEATEVKR